MRRRLFVYICILMGSLAACGKRSIPVFADADTLARALYARAGFDTEAIYGEDLKSTSAYLFGVDVADFENTVEDAVCFRKMIDSNGQMLYALKMKSEADARALADAFFSHYEFAPCDLAEKMAVAVAGEYFICFKSDSSEVATAVESFRSMMDGYMRYEKELLNRN